MEEEEEEVNCGGGVLDHAPRERSYGATTAESPTTTCARAQRKGVEKKKAISWSQFWATSPSTE